MFLCGVCHQLARHITPQVQHGVAVIFQKHPYNILADVVNIALDSGKNDLTAADRSRIAFDQGSLDDFECRLCHAGSLNQLGQEDLSLFKQLSGTVQCGDQNFVDHFHGICGFQQLGSDFCPLVFKSVGHGIGQV